MIPNKVLEKIDKAKNILIITHQKPDGDAIGSTVALGKGLKKLGKEVDYYVDQNFEDKLRFFNEIEEFNKDLKDHYDLVLQLDCSTYDFTHHPESLEYDDLVVIDHHKSNAYDKESNYVKVTAATGELIYELLETLGIELDDEMKEAIFTAISTDTGSFQFSNTQASTFHVAEELFKDGHVFAPVSKRLHKQKSKQQLDMYADAIKAIETLKDGKICVITLPYETIEKNGGDLQITDDIANIGMDLDTAILSVLIKETEPENVRVSVRSKSPYDLDVSKLALEYGGGGHLRAAGFNVKGNPEEIKKEILGKIEEIFEI